jgi:2-oxoglutarate dehydrogenase E2 component (dihydrolipoamide succinyltransferase)
VADVTIPHLNANDDTYVLLEWLMEEGQSVAAGDSLATVETSKAVTELAAEATGFLHRMVAAGSNCSPGDVVARITADRLPRQAPPAPVVETPSAGGVIVSRAAQELIDRHHIPNAAIQSLGLRFVRGSDVLPLIEAPAAEASANAADAATAPLGAHQRAVARHVTLAHRTIPAAFAASKVAAGHLLERCAREAEEARSYVGMAEVVIGVVARLRSAHPHCFAAVTDDLTVLLAQRSDIGVTIDVGTGLFVPVVREADRLTTAQIAAALMRFRARAVRRAMRDEDLAAASLTLTLHTEPDLILAQPIIFPGQTCSLSLCAIQQELQLDANGSMCTRDYFYLGLAYDHRVVNGRDAGAFLRDIKHELERP